MKNGILLSFCLLFLGVGLQAQFNASDYSIAFLTKDITPDGDLEEQGIISDLRSRGFTVDVTYNNPGSISVTPDFDFTYDALNNYDLVILGRGVSSGDFREAAEWAAVETPIIVFSAYLMRNSRMNIVNSGSASRETGDATTVDPGRVSNVAVTGHPVVTGLDADGDGEIGYHTWFIDYLKYGVDTFEMNHNASAIASWVSDTAAINGNIAVAHWEAGVETYPGSGTTSAGARAYFAMGSDDSSSPKVRNFTAFTPESTILFHNLIKAMVGATPDGVEIPVRTPFNASDYRIAFLTKDITPDGDLEEQGLISDLRQRGFTVDVTYNNPGSISVTPDFDFTFGALNDYDLVILGRGVSSGDFREAAEWAAVETPIIIFSAYLMRNSRMNIVNSGSASRETGDASTIDPGRVSNVRIADHPVFTGLDADGDGEIGYHTWFVDFLRYGVDTFEMNHNATALASWISDTAAINGNIAVAHWAPGVETYPGSGTTSAGARAYFAMGSDDSSSPKVRNFTAFTPESTTLFHNLIKIMVGQFPDGEDIPLAGEVARYSMNGSGENIADAFGAANGEIRNGNGITREGCGIGESINFAGATKGEAMIWIDDNPAIDFDGSSSFSVSTWAKIDPHANQGEMALLIKGDNKNDGSHLPNGNGHWYALATKSSEIRFAIDDDAVKTQLGVSIDETSFPADQWNHIVGVSDSDQDSLYLYLNGNLMGAVLNETDGDMSTTGLPLIIGNYHSGVRRVNGNLDEIGIWGKALSAAQVATLYAAGSPTNDCTVLETISEASNDATLSELSVDVGTLDPAFDPAIPNYSVKVPDGTNSVNITAVPTDANATVMGAGAFSDIPGTATISITAEDAIATKEYNVNFSIEGVGNSKTVVDPGFENLYNAIIAANPGDTLVLKNGEEYTPFEPYRIGKRIVIIAETIPTLPDLSNQPIINNLFAVSPLFQMEFGGDLVLIGIDVDGGGAGNIINCQGDLGVSTTQSVYVNRCRLHNTTDDIFNDARDADADMTRLERCVVRNSFLYDSGLGHAFYVKNYHGAGEYIFENITYWNIGQQFNWIRHFPAGIKQAFVYDHMTGYNLSTDAGGDKELFGNSDGDAESDLDISLKNSIFHTQVSNNEGSFKFNNTSGSNDIETRNNVLFNVKPIVDLGGSITHEGNLEGTDPQFRDPDNADFTVLNSDLWNGATDGDIIGAVYWHPDFVDDFSDLTDVEDYDILKFKFQNYPNPFTGSTNFSFELENASEVAITIHDLMGKEVRRIVNQRLSAGHHNFELQGNLLSPGMYVYRFVSNGSVISDLMIKSN